MIRERSEVMSNERAGSSIGQSLALDSGAQGRLDRSLNHARFGFPHDLRTPFFDGAPREEIAEIARSVIGFTKYKELTTIDEHELSKWGMYSWMVPWKERRSSVDDFRHQNYSGIDSVLSHAVTRVASLFPRGGFRPMEIHTAVEAMPKKTMLGLPTMSSDVSLIPQYEQRAIALRSAHEINPAVAGWRGQAAGLHELPKQRLVWMMDHVETILGLTILYPVLNRLRELDGFSAWNSDLVVDQKITKLLLHARSSGDTIVSADFSKFDASVPNALLHAVFDILRHWFAESAHERLNILEEAFTTSSLVTPDGIFGGRTGGVPSGSALTNLVDTLVNLIAGYYVAERCGVVLTKFEVLGDDSVLVFHPTPGVDVLSQAYKELGLDVNPEKQFVSDVSCHFLQRWHSLTYQLRGVSRGVRSPYRALNGMMSLEREVHLSKDAKAQRRFKYLMTARLAMQVNNVRWDPRFMALIKLWKEGDKIIRTGIDLAVVFKRAGGADEIRSSLSIASYPFNQQDPEEVETFAVTQALRSVA